MKKLLDYIAIALFPGLLFVGFIAVIVIMVKDIFASSGIAGIFWMAGFVAMCWAIVRFAQMSPSRLRGLFKSDEK